MAVDIPSSSSAGLRRALGAFAAAAFVVTNMVGTGIFTIPAFVRTSTGSGPASLAVWLTGGVAALCGALCYAELATRMPEAGGEYHYLTRVYGRLWGFLSGWISFLIGFSSAIAVSALGAMEYAAKVIPGWNPQTELIAGSGITEGAVAAAILIAMFSLFHSTGIRPGGNLQTIIAGTVIAAILLLVFAGVASHRGDWRGVTTTTQTRGTWWIALIQVTFAYSGWNAAAYLAGEVHHPHRTLPRALIGGTVVVTALYLLLNILFLYAVPANEWKPAVAIGSIAAERLFGTTGAKAVSLIITLTILGSVSSMIAAGPRVYYAMARDRLAHSIFARLHATTGVPMAAILLQALVAMLLAMTGAFDTLLIYAGSALPLFTGLAVLSLFFLPRNSSKESFRVPGYPVTPAIYVLLTAIAFFQGLRERPKPTGAALLTVLIGVGLYFLSLKFGWLRETPADEPQG